MGIVTTATSRTWSIAELADEFGITHRAIRYYETQGLLAPQREGTARIFHRRDHVRLNLILRGKRLGFDLSEIRRILDMYDEVPGEAGQLRYVLSQIADRRAELKERRDDIDAALAELDTLQDRCSRRLMGVDTLDQ